MGAFYLVFGLMELSAGLGYTTRGMHADVPASWRAAAKPPTEPQETVRLSGQLRESRPVKVRAGVFFGA